MLIMFGLLISFSLHCIQNKMMFPNPESYCRNCTKIYKNVSFVNMQSFYWHARVYDSFRVIFI